MNGHSIQKMNQRTITNKINISSSCEDDAQSIMKLPTVQKRNRYRYLSVWYKVNVLAVGFQV